MKFTKPILVTGATGYVGGRLIAQLLAAGYSVRAMGRSLEKLACRPWARHSRLELIHGDVLDLTSLEKAAQGCDTAFYLVHTMIAQKGGFVQADRQGALNMTIASERAALTHIIYLGGLGDVNHPHLSHHLASRHEVGDILQSGNVPATVLRAAMILGSGSASFEILRYLVERLPIMITPRWVRNMTQPIAIYDVLNYLMGCLNNKAVYGGTFDIGGPDILNYMELIKIYAEEAGLPKRRVIPVPVLTPKLSARWIHLVTPVPAAIALPLTEGLSIPTICADNRINELIPLKLTPCRAAVRSALDRILQKQVETCWTDAGEINPPEWAFCGDADYAGGTVLTCSYRMRIDVPAHAIWSEVTGIGGENGYYYGNFLWRLRGILDRLIGGVGLRRGRRHPQIVMPGDALDFWRVLTVENERRLTLLAEMKVPGEAILDIQIYPLEERQCELRLMSRFLPCGLGGLLYWYVLYPLHVLIFKGMLSRMAKAVGGSQIESPRAFDPKEDSSCALSVRRNIIS